MNPEQKRFLALIAFNAIIIFGFFSYKYYTYSTGTEMLLEVVYPVDPQDLFRGNYVTLTYAINTIELSHVTYDYRFDYRDDVYAVLSKKDTYWTIDSLSHSRPHLSEGQVCMKSRVSYANPNRVDVRWGIENFFAPPDIAQKIDENKWKGEVDAIAIADSNCNVILKSIIADGQEIKTSLD